MIEQMPLELETRNKELETDQLETRNKYREHLRQHLSDPNFRAIEGFPIGEDPTESGEAGIASQWH